MYPDTDSAPIAITEEMIERARRRLPVRVDRRLAQLREWNVPQDTFAYLLRHNLVSLVERIAGELGLAPRFVATLLAHRLKHLQGRSRPEGPSFGRIYDLLLFIRERGLEPEIASEMLPLVYERPEMDLEAVLSSIGYAPRSRDDIVARIPALREEFARLNTSRDPEAGRRWIMGWLRPLALGNMPLVELAAAVGEGETR